MEVEGEPAPVSLQLSNFRSVETHGNNDTVKKAGRVLLKCCCCNKPVKSKKLTFAGPNRVQTNHTNFQYGLDNKGVDTAKDADSPDLIKAQMYGYNYHPSVPAAQVPNTYDSTSNSNNGGSVNSQVSLITVMFRAILKQFIKTVWSADKSEGCHLVRPARR